MRRTVTLTALLLGATLVVPTGSATAAGETCRGRAATIVGTGAPIVGTAGDDVIYSGASTDIAGGAGNDVICVVTPIGADPSQSSGYWVDAGPGDDLIDSTGMGATFELEASLGDGADIFVGGAGNEHVAAGAAAKGWSDLTTELADESERDVIDTGSGDDTVASGGPVVVNDDEVRLGDGDDVARWSGLMTPLSVLDGGTGSDQFVARATGQTYTLDLAAQQVRRNGTVSAAFSAIERLEVRAVSGVGNVEIVGSDGADEVEISDVYRLKADLGAGDDTLLLSAQPESESEVDLGVGRDSVAVLATDRTVALNLEEESLSVANGSPLSVIGAQDAFVVAKKVLLVGDRRANSLSWSSCAADVTGGGGKDTLAVATDDIWDTTPTCAASKRAGDKIRGGKGNDTITAGQYADRIYGDAGNDTINAGPAGESRNRVWGGGGDDTITGGADRDVFFGGAGDDTLLGRGGTDAATGDNGIDTCKAEVKNTCEN